MTLGNVESMRPIKLLGPRWELMGRLGSTNCCSWDLTLQGGGEEEEKPRDREGKKEDSQRTMTGGQMMKRIPRIKFPQRHPPPSGLILAFFPPSFSLSPPPFEITLFFVRFSFNQTWGDVLAGQAAVQQVNSSVVEPKTQAASPDGATAVGGKASLQPSRTPVSDKEIESILVLFLHSKIVDGISQDFDASFQKILREDVELRISINFLTLQLGGCF